METYSFNLMRSFRAFYDKTKGFGKNENFNETKTKNYFYF